MYKDGFVKIEKLELLEEYHRSTDLLDLSENVAKLRSVTSGLKYSYVIWLIGKLGSWKTTFINQFINTLEETCFQFEAWKYPWRKDLRENFVLEIAEQLGNKKQVINKIDGKQNEGTKTLVDMLVKLPGKWLDYIPVIESVQTWVNYFLQSSPATRTFQLQELLTELLNETKWDTIYIAVEDVDRAWDEWLFFLETLNYYIKESGIKKQIIVIALIWEENYDEPKNRLSFKKCLDIEEQFEIDRPGFSRFVEEIFIDDILSIRHEKGQVRSFLEWIFKEYPSITTMRMIKSILRQANIHYKRLVAEQWQGIDWRLCILIQTAKEIWVKDKGVTFYNKRKKEGKISDLNTIFGSLISCVISSNPTMRSIQEESIYDRNNNNGLNERKYKIHSINIVKDEYKGSKINEPIWVYENRFEGINSEFRISSVYFK